MSSVVKPTFNKYGYLNAFGTQLLWLQGKIYIKKRKIKRKWKEEECEGENNLKRKNKHNGHVNLRLINNFSNFMKLYIDCKSLSVDRHCSCSVHKNPSREMTWCFSFPHSLPPALIYYSVCMSLCVCEFYFS